MGDGRGPAIPTVYVANEGLGQIVGRAALGVDGVADLGGNLATGLSDMLGRSAPRGVRVEVTARAVEVTCHLVVQYGVRIPEVAQRVQEQVQRQLEHATGLRVRRVDIHIQGVKAVSDGAEVNEGPEH